jgi:hypothetical protein
LIAKNKWLILIISAVTLFYFGNYAYRSYNKLTIEKWLSRIDISSFLIQNSDLPSGFSPGEIKDLKPDDYSRFIQGKEQEIIASDGNKVGTVRIYLFSLKSQQEEMFNRLGLMEIPEGMIPLNIDNIGEMQLAAIDPYGLIVFTRCTSIGYLQIDQAELQKGYDTDVLIAHAKRIDERLQTIACEQK